MPIPDNQKIHVEVHSQGLITAGGSSSKVTLQIYHFRRTSVVNVPSKTVFDTAYQAAIAVPVAAALNNRWAQQFNTIRWLDDAQDAPVQVPHVVVGGVAGDSDVMMNSAFVLFRTGIRGKSFKGGKHYGPLSEADTTAPNTDVLNAAAVARFATLQASLIAGFADANGNTWRLEVVTRTLSQLTVNPTTVTAFDVTQIMLNQRIGRMSTRNPVSLY